MSRPERADRPPSRIGALVATALVALGFLSVAFVNADVASSLGVLVAAPDPPSGSAAVAPERFVPILFAIAALCVLGLAWRGSPTIRGLAAILAVVIGSVEVMAAVRGVLPYLGPDSWVTPSGIASLACVAAVAVAAAYLVESRPDGPRAARVATAVAVLGIGATVATATWAVAVAASDAARGAADLDVWPLRLAIRVELAALIAFAALAAFRDVWPAVGRAWTRSAVEGRHDLHRFGVLLGDELLPWRVASHAERRRAAEEERARLAAELHARVLPDLRFAVATAAATPGVPEPIALGLRSALDDVEGLMAARQSIVLEEHGLLAALEWLAERTEERSPTRVSIDVEADHPGSPRPPRMVERAAFRIALLALDNVVRHAGARSAVVALAVSPATVSLAIHDDGRGLPHTAKESARTGTSRGIADMHSQAASIGASVEVTSGNPGALVRFRWPA